LGTATQNSGDFRRVPRSRLLVLEERLGEQQAEGVQMPAGVALDDLALRVLIAAELSEASAG
jgi:hypothetical protein